MEDQDNKGHSHRLRRGRWSEPNQIYLVTTATVGRSPLLGDLRAGRCVVQALKHERAATTLCYVVMPDHLHWLLQLAGTDSLQTVVGRVKSMSARWINRHLGRSGSIWQDSYHDRALRREEDIRTVARYVVMNPVRAELVRSVREYPLWDAIWL